MFHTVPALRHHRRPEAAHLAFHFRSIGAGVAAVLVMLLPQVVYVDNVLSESRMFLVAVVFSVAAFFVFILLRKMVTERVVREERVEKVSYLPRSSPFSRTARCSPSLSRPSLWWRFTTPPLRVNNLVFQFYFHDAEKASFAMIASYVPLLALMPFASTIVGKVGKKRFIVLGGLGSMLAGVLMLFLPITPTQKAWCCISPG